MRNFSKRKGQALIEYLLIFSIMSLIGVKLVVGMTEFMGDQMGNFSYVLTKELTVGVCPGTCYLNDYKNRTP
jgi:hypothetical protein